MVECINHIANCGFRSNNLILNLSAFLMCFCILLSNLLDRWLFRVRCFNAVLFLCTVGQYSRTQAQVNLFLVYSLDFASCLSVLYCFFMVLCCLLSVSMSLSDSGQDMCHNQLMFVMTP